MPSCTVRPILGIRAGDPGGATASKSSVASPQQMKHSTRQKD